MMAFNPIILKVYVSISVAASLLCETDFINSLWLLGLLVR